MGGKERITSYRAKGELEKEKGGKGEGGKG